MYRKLEEKDRPLIEEEIRKDPYHSTNGFSANEFFGPSDTIVFYDEQGPVCFMNAKKEARIRVQFCEVDKDRIRKVLSSHTEQVSSALKKLGYYAMTFETTNPALAWFMHKLEFKASQHEFRKEL